VKGVPEVWSVRVRCTGSRSSSLTIFPQNQNFVSREFPNETKGGGECIYHCLFLLSGVLSLSLSLFSFFFKIFNKDYIPFMYASSHSFFTKINVFNF